MHYSYSHASPGIGYFRIGQILTKISAIIVYNKCNREMKTWLNNVDVLLLFSYLNMSPDSPLVESQRRKLSDKYYINTNTMANGPLIRKKHHHQHNKRSVH